MVTEHTDLDNVIVSNVVDVVLPGYTHTDDMRWQNKRAAWIVSSIVLPNNKTASFFNCVGVKLFCQVIVGLSLFIITLDVLYCKHLIHRN